MGGRAIAPQRVFPRLVPALVRLFQGSGFLQGHFWNSNLFLEPVIGIMTDNVVNVGREFTMNCKFNCPSKFMKLCCYLLAQTLL